MLRRVVIASLLIATAAAAQSSKQADLAKVEAEQHAREQERADTLKEADQVRRDLAELTAQLAELSKAQAGGETDVSDKRLKLAALNAREAQLDARAGADRNRLAHLLGALQMFSRDPPPALLLHAADAKDAVRAAILIRAMTPDLERKVRELAAEADTAKAARRDAAAGAGDLFSAESTLAERAARIETTLAQKTVLEQALTEQAANAGQAIDALALRAAALRAVVGKLPPAPALATAALRGVQPGSLLSPIPAQPSLRFGQPDAGGRPSEGWDWTTAPGAAVTAPSGGLVDYAGPVEGWRQVVILNLGNETRLVLAGLDLALVAPGQSVTAGQTLGRMAQSGRPGVGSGGILHLEVRKNRQTVDPASLMARR